MIPEWYTIWLCPILFIGHLAFTWLIISGKIALSSKMRHWALMMLVLAMLWQIARFIKQLYMIVQHQELLFNDQWVVVAHGFSSADAILLASVLVVLTLFQIEILSVFSVMSTWLNEKVLKIFRAIIISFYALCVASVILAFQSKLLDTLSGARAITSIIFAFFPLSIIIYETIHGLTILRCLQTLMDRRLQRAEENGEFKVSLQDFGQMKILVSVIMFLDYLALMLYVIGFIVDDDASFFFRFYSESLINLNLLCSIMFNVRMSTIKFPSARRTKPTKMVGVPQNSQQSSETLQSNHINANLMINAPGNSMLNTKHSFKPNFSGIFASWTFTSSTSTNEDQFTL